MAQRTAAPPHPADWVTLVQLLETRPFLTERKVRRLVAERRITFFKPDRTLLFRLADIDAWVERSRVEPAPS